MNVRASRTPRRRPFRPRLAAVALLAAAGLSPLAAAEARVGEGGGLILLVRHAEKAGEHGNVNLSPPGLARAAALAQRVPELGAVFVTGLCRTAQTAAPVARAQGLPLTVQPIPGGGLAACEPPVDDLVRQESAVPAADEAGLAAAVAARADESGAVLVVGHSNTVPGLVRQLTGVDLCPDPFPLDERRRCLLPDDDYHHLFVLRRAAAGAAGWELEHASYGAGPPPGEAKRDVAAAQRLQQEANAAYREGDLAGFTELMEQALAANPASQATRYNLACGYARSGRPDDALRMLTALVDDHVDFGMARDPDLASLRERPELQALAARLEASTQPISSSTEAKTFEQLGLIPEGIAVDAASGRTFFGSMRTGEVYALSAEGALSKFAEVRHDGRRLSAVGMTVDAPRKLLWVAGTVFFMTEGFDPEAPGLGGAFAFDLETGELRRSHVVAGEGAGFNDVAVAADGTVYLTGDGVSTVAATAEPGAVPRLLAGTAAMVGANGLTLTPDGATLFVSVYPVGVARVDLATGSWSYLGEPDGWPLIGIDGLYWARGDLVAIQNGLRPWRLLRLTLNEAGSAVTGVRVIELGNAEISPTTGAIVDDEILYVGAAPAPQEAPSQFPARLGPALGRVRIFRAPLDGGIVP